jgi:hypothetical protein
MTPRIALALVVGLVTAGSVPPQDAALTAVLERTGAYVADFEQQFAGIVAEERYAQDWKALPAHWPNRREPRHRDLRSDLLLVKLAPDGSWMQFRDVIEVDGVPIGNRTDRLMQLFVSPSPSLEAQLAHVLDESARYNVGNLHRTVNTPLLALVFLDPEHQPRFRFFRTNDRKPQLGDEGLSKDLWVIRYEEVQAHTMIRTDGLQDLPSHGRFWIEMATGHVMMTEVVAEDKTVRMTIDVRYQADARLGLPVPIEMRERYEGRTNGSRIEGTATYDRFRQFQVNVDEKFQLKK